ncbi:MAG: PilZ domain-containing protein [Chromatiaceae bacterium]|jgi:hypothetical protein
MDKRTHHRVEPAVKGWHVELVDQLTNSTLGGVVNLSPGGLMLITSMALDIEGLYQVELSATGPNGEHIQFLAGVMVLWCSGASRKGTYWVGLKVIDIDTASRERLVLLSELMASGG